MPRSTLFPPRLRKRFHERVLEEILQERVVPQRGRRNPRGVKRNMSNFNLRPRHAELLKRIDIEKAIRGGPSPRTSAEPATLYSGVVSAVPARGRSDAVTRTLPSLPAV